MNDEVFRVCVETTSRDSYNFDNIPEPDALDCARRYILRSGAGLRFVAPTGAFFWTWAEIHAVRFVRGSFTAEQYP